MDTDILDEKYKIHLCKIRDIKERDEDFCMEIKILIDLLD